MTAVVWCGIAHVGNCDATSGCTLKVLFCSNDHLRDWREDGRSAPKGFRLSMDAAHQVGRAMFAPMLPAGHSVRGHRMTSKRLFATRVIGTIVAAVCCAAPALAVVLGVLGLSAWFAYADYIVLPAMMAFITIAGYALRRLDRRRLLKTVPRRAIGQSRKRAIVPG